MSHIMLTRTKLHHQYTIFDEKETKDNILWLITKFH